MPAHNSRSLFQPQDAETRSQPIARIDQAVLEFQLKVEVIAMHDIPETGFLRLPQVLDVIPVGKTCWWEGVKKGRYPKPVKLSPRCTAWRAEDIRHLIESLSGQHQMH